MENAIDITGSDKIEVIKKAYELSEPQGLGFLHHTPGPLSDEQADEILNRRPEEVYMDYVNGRSCKFRMWEEDGKLFIRDSWYDHSQNQLNQLVEAVTANG